MMWKNVIVSFFRNKSLPVLLLTAAVLFGVSLSLRAAESTEEGIVHNEEAIDPYTGNTVTEEGKTEQAAVPVSGRCYYDRNTGEFVTNYGSLVQTCLRSSVADGMFVNGTVTLDPGTGLQGKLYRNGRELQSPDLSAITEPGSYVYTVSLSGDTDLRSFRFRIIERYTNAASFELPEGFSFREITRSGESLSVTGRILSLEKEGDYEVLYSCDASESLYRVTLTADHTAPELILPEVDEQGIARSAVDLSSVEAGAAIYVEQDGKEYRLPVSRVLTAPGFYRVTLQDDAGNVTTGSFTIRMYFTVSTTLVIILILLLIIGLAVFTVLSGRRLRIR